jgi:hypothetical protein
MFYILVQDKYGTKNTYDYETLTHLPRVGDNVYLPDGVSYKVTKVTHYLPNGANVFVERE